MDDYNIIRNNYCKKSGITQLVPEPHLAKYLPQYRLLRKNQIMGRKHQQKTFPSGQNASVTVDALGQSRQGHPGGGLLCARH
jgi:hypothetical protein